MNPAINTENKEGETAKKIENQTAKFPSDIFLWAPLGSTAVSAALQLAQKKIEVSSFCRTMGSSFSLIGIIQ